jgi:hypothetical protein
MGTQQMYTKFGGENGHMEDFESLEYNTKTYRPINDDENWIWTYF